ncbi:hypothetical protein ACXGQW_01070 [Wenyingzhuangia sp. IMCC45533]
MNFKNIFFALLSILLVSCEEDEVDVLTPQEIYDNDKSNIEAFINATYYDESIDMFKIIDDNQVSLKNDPNLTPVTYRREGIDYIVYVYKTKEGSNISPDSNDIVKVGFEYFNFIANDEGNFPQIDLFNQNTGISNIERERTFFRNLATEDNAYTATLPLFKSGDVVESVNGPRTFENSGEGLLIVPTGLEPTINGGVFRQTLIIRIQLRNVTEVTNPN